MESTSSPVSQALGISEAETMNVIPREAVARPFVKEWFSNFNSQFKDGRPQAIPAEIVPSSSDGDFAGWIPTQPPVGYLAPPLAIGLLLPLNEPCPVPQLEPWWNEVTVRSVSQAPQLSLMGSCLRPAYREHSPNRWHCESTFGTARLDAYEDGYLNAWVRVGQKREGNVKRTGFVGVLVPGYSEIKDGIAAISEMAADTDYFDFGFRLSMDAVSAIVVRLAFHKSIPWFGAQKATFQQRGYGPCSDFSIGLEFTDGWRPLRMELQQSDVRYEDESVGTAFADRLIGLIVDHRSRVSWIDEEERAAISDLGIDWSNVQTFDFEDRIVYKWRCDVAGSRPISVLEGNTPTPIAFTKPKTLDTGGPGGTNSPGPESPLPYNFDTARPTTAGTDPAPASSVQRPQAATAPHRNQVQAWRQEDGKWVCGVHDKAWCKKCPPRSSTHAALVDRPEVEWRYTNGKWVCRVHDKAWCKKCPGRDQPPRIPERFSFAVWARYCRVR